MNHRLIVCIAAILFGLLTQGCSTVVLLDAEEPLDNDRVYNYEQLNSRLVDVPATVLCIGGAVYQCDSLRVVKDIAVYFDRSAGLQRQLNTRDILKVSYTDHLAGAFNGGVVGTLGGIGVGVGVLLLASDGSSDSRMGVAVLFLGTVGAGALMGTVVGSLAGSTHEFWFKNGESTRHTSSITVREAAP